MADDKLKTGPESPGSDSPGDAPVENAPVRARHPSRSRLFFPVKAGTLWPGLLRAR